MMNNGTLVDPELRRTNPAILGQSERTDHKRIGNVSASRNLESWNIQYNIRLAKLPATFLPAGLRVLDLGTFHRATIHPSHNLADLFRRKGPIVEKLQP
jgi:hypothetical protein